MNTKKLLSMGLAAMMINPLLTSDGINSVTQAVDAADIEVTVDLNGYRKTISPYIYGVNSQFRSEEYLYDATAGSARQGGNRFSGYNWETNFSNAGRDWEHNSDQYLIDFNADLLNTPGAPAIEFAQEAASKNVSYKITTIQMAGYVSADDDGTITEDEIAPSSRWKEVKARKETAFSLSPDTTDDYVYMDEYVNYLVQTLGDATTSTGYQAYNLDNEPSLWSSTHARMHPEQTTCEEIVTKSIEYASAIKDVDPYAEIFGLALFGVNAYTSFSNAPDWSEHSSDYDWFVSYYLDEMRKAEEACGKRLIDVIDLHYYSEAKGQCRVTECEDYTHTDCIEARLQSTRTLYDPTYIEDSWIGEYEQEYLPVFPLVQESIDTYYPDTKLALTEYNFGGGNHISGAVAEADALGVFAQNGVYAANLWAINSSFEYQLSAIDLYTNYDGNGAAFGDTLVNAFTSDMVTSTAYAAIDGTDESRVNVVITNKNQTEDQQTVIHLNGSASYDSAKVYAITGDTHEIRLLQTVNSIDNNTLTIDIPALSVVQVELLANDYTMLGDVNTDGTVDLADAKALADHLVLRPDSAISAVESDINSDQTVNAQDLTLLKQMLLQWNTPIEQEVLVANWATKTGQWRIKNGMSGETITCVFTGDPGNGLNLAYGYWDTAAIDPDTGTAGMWFNNDDTALGKYTFDSNGEANVTFTVPENCASLELIIFNYTTYDAATGATTQLDKSGVGLKKVVLN